MNMGLTKKDTQMAKGVAVLGMVMLHLFCRLGNLPYTPWIWVREVPLIYYLVYSAIYVCRSSAFAVDMPIT